jgi:hypothetical protein
MILIGLAGEERTSIAHTQEWKRITIIDKKPVEMAILKTEQTPIISMSISSRGTYYYGGTRRHIAVY